MAYIKTVWLESGLTTTAKVNGLNNLETIQDEEDIAMVAFPHSIYLKADADARYYHTPAHAPRSDTGEGCGIDAQLVDGFSYTDLINASMPLGTIIMFGSGAIPGGFAECDGTGGTPDLRTFMPVGSGLGKVPGNTGGADTAVITKDNYTTNGHALAANEIPGHTHTYTDWYNSTPDHATSASGGPQSYKIATSGPPTVTKISTTMDPGSAAGPATAHVHGGSSFNWSGYYDDQSNFHAGNLDIRPSQRAVKFIVRV